MIYTAKLTAFVLIVVSTFMVLKFFGMNVDTLFGAAVMFNTFAIWIISTGHAFRMAEYMEEIRRNLRSARVKLTITWSSEMAEWKAIKAELRAMRPLHLSEGVFRNLHKESALEFMDFYVSRVIALMLEFP